MLNTLMITWMSLCALIDARSRRLPNLLLGVGLAGAILILFTTHQTITGATWGTALTAMLLGFLLGLPGYRLGQMGAGDVKLLAVLGLATDISHLLLSIAGAGLFLALWALLAKRLWAHLPKAIENYFKNFSPENQKRLPYAPFLLFGLIFSILII